MIQSTMMYAKNTDFWGTKSSGEIKKFEVLSELLDKQEIVCRKS